KDTKVHEGKKGLRAPFVKLRALRGGAFSRRVPEKTNYDSLLSLWLCGSVVKNYLSLSVVSANRAKTSEAIQKRTMIFDSDHPISSKWWCMGAILKIRFLRNL